MTLFEYDNEIRKSYAVFCGVDEAGRGPLAGDVYAAAVVLKPYAEIEFLDDSKKLSEKKRNYLYDIVIDNAIAYCVSTATVEEIEKYNILQATFLAMRRAVDGLSVNVDIALVDGNRDPGLKYKTETIVKGDGTSASIAAASILAKVSRDRYMENMAMQYPQYQFEKHKGYGTKLHYEILSEYGPSPIHRMSFLKKFYEHDK